MRLKPWSRKAWNCVSVITSVVPLSKNAMDAPHAQGSMVRAAQPWSVLYSSRDAVTARCEHTSPECAAVLGNVGMGALSQGWQSPPGPGPPVATTRNADAVNKHAPSVANRSALPCFCHAGKPQKPSACALLRNLVTRTQIQTRFNVPTKKCGHNIHQE
jgi:hypothetical protein